MNKFNLVFLCSVFLMVGLGCSSMMKGKELADPAVEKFHAQFNAAQYIEIYDGADDEFKKNVKSEEWIQLMEAVRRKVGTITKATNTGWHVNTTPLGTEASVTCDVEFSDGKGSEQFVFHITGDEAKLYNYRIDSPQLITR